MAIRAEHYATTEQALIADPVVRRMARDLLIAGQPKSALAHDSGTPRHEFTVAANTAYRDLGGTYDGPLHLGAIATAVLAIAYDGALGVTEAEQKIIDAFLRDDVAEAAELKRQLSDEEAADFTLKLLAAVHANANSES